MDVQLQKSAKIGFYPRVPSAQAKGIGVSKVLVIDFVIDYVIVQ